MDEFVFHFSFTSNLSCRTLFETRKASGEKTALTNLSSKHGWNLLVDEDFSFELKGV